MSERAFRLILGVVMWMTLTYSAYFETLTPVYALVGFLLFESLTNLRLTLISQRLRFGKEIQNDNPECASTMLHRLDSERVLRVIVAFFILAPFLLLPDLLWFLPWFTAGMLIMAGITNICPMAMFLKWSGMK